MTYDDIIAYCARKGYPRRYARYWAEHMGCEACGAMADAPHHIRTRGAGGGEEKGNLMSLCAEHHRQIHTKGQSWFCEKYPWLGEKVLAAKRGGKVCS